MSKTAVITGATSGIGAAYAKRLAAEGYDLILTGRRQEIIQNLADDLTGQYDVNVNVIIAELSDDDDIQKLIDAIKTSENIEILINNAGHSGYFKEFLEVDPSHYEQMIKVHQTVPIRLISIVAPKMVKRRKGTIINVASVAAFNPAPKFNVYASTKSFLKSFSEGLHQELKDKGIKVQALCPGLTETNFAKDYLTEEEFGKIIGSMKKITMSPEAVVDCSLKHLKKKKVVCIPGTINKAMASFLAMIPRGLYYKISAKMFEM
jgi:short-subunit dehydrogenase